MNGHLRRCYVDVVFVCCFVFTLICKNEPPLKKNIFLPMHKIKPQRSAVQSLCFPYTDSTITLLFKFEISSFKPASATVHASLSDLFGKPEEQVFCRFSF